MVWGRHKCEIVFLGRQSLQKIKRQRIQESDGFRERSTAWGRHREEGLCGDGNLQGLTGRT